MLAQVHFSTSTEEGALGDWLNGSQVTSAGALRWNYGLAADLRTRPTVGGMAEGGAAAARDYWATTYALKYGGADTGANS